MRSALLYEINTDIGYLNIKLPRSARVVQVTLAYDPVVVFDYDTADAENVCDVTLRTAEPAKTRSAGTLAWDADTQLLGAVVRGRALFYVFMEGFHNGTQDRETNGKAAVESDRHENRRGKVH